MSINAEFTTDAQAFLEEMLRRMNLTMSDWVVYVNRGVADTPDQPASDSRPHCGDSISWLRDTYRPIHGYLALVVCVLGSVANLFNIVVLTSKGVVSPTNAILTGLAVADMAVMIEYIPFALVHYIFGHSDEFGYGVTVYVLFHAHFAQVFHTIAIWMTVMLAVWRFLAIVHPHMMSRHGTMRRCMLYMAAAYVMSPIICIPSYFTFVMHERTSGSSMLYRIDISPMARRHGGLLLRVNFWLYSVLIKLVPCSALTYLSMRMIRVLLETKRRKQRLMSGPRQLQPGHRLSNSTCQTDRTTWMLVTVLLLFLLTEFPQGILALLSAVLQDQFFRTCYVHLGELLDILALINSAINFLLYCLMSKQFRTTFRLMLRLPAKPGRQLPGPDMKLLHISKHTDVTSV